MRLCTSYTCACNMTYNLSCKTTWNMPASGTGIAFHPDMSMTWNMTISLTPSTTSNCTIDPMLKLSMFNSSHWDVCNYCWASCWYQETWQGIWSQVWREHCDETYNRITWNMTSKIMIMIIGSAITIQTEVDVTWHATWDEKGHDMLHLLLTKVVVAL